jgi:predicted dehydrogenase
MRFALLGDHPDGLDMARALVESGRHELAVYSGSSLGTEYLARWGLQPPCVGDMEEVLANSGVEAVIVAGGSAVRPAQLRRALQSERHALCVHPADGTPDIAYEAAMIRADTGGVLLPLMPGGLHPGVRRFAELARAAEQPRLIEFERWSTEVLAGDDTDGRGLTLPDWDVLRSVGGEIAEVFALAGGEGAWLPGEPLIVAGRFVDGLIFQAAYVPEQTDARWRLVLAHRIGQTVLEFPDGWPGPSRLIYMDEGGGARSEEWPAVNPWLGVVEAFEQALARPPAVAPLVWQDELRALELDDAVRRSLERRRSSTLEYQEATEEAGFKGTMTLVGCGLLWLSLVLLILSPWQPKLLWGIAPVFGTFLLLQLFRWVIPARSTSSNGPRPDHPPTDGRSSS